MTRRKDEQKERMMESKKDGRKERETITELQQEGEKERKTESNEMDITLIVSH